ncbi:hypothetical protein AMELA_G00011680, partial [Ameiurus melas]
MRMRCSVLKAAGGHQILTGTLNIDPAPHPLLFRDSLFYSLSSVKLVQFMCQLLNVFMLIRIFTHVKKFAG